jgi:hypothetical protein
MVGSARVRRFAAIGEDVAGTIAGRTAPSKTILRDPRY